MRLNDANGKIAAEYARALFFARNYRDAIEAAEAVLALIQEASVFTWIAVDAAFHSHVALGNPQRAKEVLDNFLLSAPPGWDAQTAHMLAALGRTDDALALLKLHTGTGHMTRSSALLTQTLLGDLDAAFKILHVGIEERTGAILTGFHNDPRLAPLREDPRWSEAVRRLEAEESGGE